MIPEWTKRTAKIAIILFITGFIGSLVAGLHYIRQQLFPFSPWDTRKRNNEKLESSLEMFVSKFMVGIVVLLVLMVVTFIQRRVDLWRKIIILLLLMVVVRTRPAETCTFTIQ